MNIDSYILFVATYFVVQFQMYSEPSQGSGDDSTTNKIAVLCRGPGLRGTDTYTMVVPGAYDSGASWGLWSAQCPSGQAVNAFQVIYAMIKIVTYY